ncbi:hypothetical protein ACE40V_24675, partial [Salmonella enterica]|uniref:hypothetical protein n=1 Tax=Salmonella enterica TaxID=28901 RepID=UPI003D298957
LLTVHFLLFAFLNELELRRHGLASLLLEMAGMNRQQQLCTAFVPQEQEWNIIFVPNSRQTIAST